jgi:hypothetical protein
LTDEKVIVPGDAPITPYPDFGENRNNEQPYSIFEPVTPFTSKYLMKEEKPLRWISIKRKKPSKGMHNKGWRFK